MTPSSTASIENPMNVGEGIALTYELVRKERLTSMEFLAILHIGSLFSLFEVAEGAEGAERIVEGLGGQGFHKVTTEKWLPVVVA